MSRLQKIYEKQRKLGTRLLALLLAVVMVLGSNPSIVVQAESVREAWDGVSREIPKTDEQGVYLIENGAQLAWFADEVNSGKGELNARLMNYIYLNDYNTSYKWMMIGNTTDHPYRGNFDGNGQKIVYMHAEINTSDTEHRYAGLFGVIDGGSVKNLTVLGKVIHGYGNFDTEYRNDQLATASGGIVGYLKNGTIVNCVNYARTTMDEETIYRNAGGIAGICEGVISRCENYGKLSTTIGMAQNHVGGIVGLLYGANAQVTTCSNHAVVQGYYCVGGIAGGVKSGGQINTSCNYGAVKGNSIVGGIAGRVSTTGMYSNGTAKECGIYDVYNIGQISGYGSSTGTELGGIVGEAGCEKWTQESLPPMPVIERAYSIANVPSGYRNGSVIGYLLSGAYGTVYAMNTAVYTPTVIGATNNRAVKILGEARKITSDEMKSVAILEKLGSAFTMASVYDSANMGYPKFVWQGLPSDILDRVDEAQLELNSWLSENNRKKYGKNYVTIEELVKTYKEQLGAVTSEAELDLLMAEARKKLEAVKPGVGQDSELAEAIDNGIIALEEYAKRLVKENPELSEKEQAELDNVLTVWKEKLEEAASEEEVRTIVRDGKDAMEDQIAAFTADKKLEEVRANALQILETYRASETYDVLWMHKIKVVRDAAKESIGKAQTTAQINQLLEQAKADIDAVIQQIPEAGAWDGVTRTEPQVNENGVFQITSGSELAWFADQVNQGTGNISAELCQDISMGGKNWTPIGKNSSVPFSGSFDGLGHIIRDLYLNVEDTYVGLFGIVQGGSGQRIQNLSVSGTIDLGGRISYVGGIVGYVKGKESDVVQILNCHNSVRISVADIKTLDAGVGGIAGSTQNAKIQNCSNQASVQITSEGRGGLTYYTGGLLGNARANTRIDASSNKGTVWSPHASGGLIGGVLGSDVICYSSYNAGDVSGLYYAGGLCGEILSQDADFGWCYTSGGVNLKDSGLALGALFGKITGGNHQVLLALKRADNMGRTIVGSSGDFSASGKFVSDKELKSDDIMNSLNGGGNCFIHDYLGFQNGYPILSWEMTLDSFKTGSITALQNSVQQEDYSEENWAVVQELLAAAAQQIQAAADMESIDAIRTQTLEAIAQVETKEGTLERKLQEAKDEAINILENYVDLSVYREEEQSEIRSLVANAKKYILLADSIEEVERHRDETREKIDRLPDAWQYYEQLNMAAATQVDSYIMSIGEVVYTSYVKLSIEIARSAYESLTDAQKALVSTYQILLEAEAEWARLEEENTYTEEEMNLAAQVDELIGAIGTVTEESEEVIQKARYAYDSLTEKQRTLVSLGQVLIDAENTYNQLKASVVIAAIASIGEVTLEKKEVIFAAQDLYDRLSEVQKGLVTDYQVLQNAILLYNNLVVVQPVIEQIQELGSVESVTLESKDVIQAAISAYNGLTGEQQELVTNYEILEAMVSVYDSLVKIDYVTRLIDGIGVVSSASGSQISAARSAYDALTLEEQKQILNRSVLENAEAAYKALQNAQTSTETENDKIYGNQETLESLVGSTNHGSNTTTLESVAGSKDTADKEEEIEEETEEKKEESDVDDGMAETEEESSDLPSWLEDQLKEEEAEAVLVSEKENAENKRRRTIAVVLGIMFASCAVMTGSFGAALLQGAKKRKSKQVHY